MRSATLWSVTLDCADAKELAAFWAAALDGKIAYDVGQLRRRRDARAGCGSAPTRCAATPRREWPDGQPRRSSSTSTSSVDDLDAAEQAALDLGATKAEHQPEPDRWRVLLDPAGHPFCITTMA